MRVTGDLSALCDPLVSALCEEGGTRLIDHNVTHWLLKRLIAMEGERGDRSNQRGTICSMLYIDNYD